MTKREHGHHFHVVPCLLIANRWLNVWARVTVNQQIANKSRGHASTNYEDTHENWIGGRDDKAGTIIFKTHLHRKNTYRRN